MVAFSEIIIILSIALLAVIVTIFVFAASLLREAIPQALEKQREIAGEHNKEFEVTIADMQTALNAARGTGGFGELEKKSHEYDRKRKQFEKASKRIEKKYQLLKTRGGVVYPAAVLLLALALAGSVQLVTALVWQGVLFGMSTLAVGWVCYRIYEIALVVQSIATMPEDAVDKTTKAFEKALDRHEEKKRVNLQLVFTNPKPPFKFKPSCKQIVKYSVFLTQGDVAKASWIYFMVPKNFKLPEVETHIRSVDDEPFPDMLQAIIEVGDLKRGLEYYYEITIEPPPEPGIYILVYYLNCEGYPGKYVEFEVEVAA